MRINKNILSLVALAGFLSTGGSLQAQSFKLGYCTTEVRTPGLKAQITGSHSFHAAVEFGPSLLNKYVGDQIDSVQFAISPKRGNMAEVFVCTDLDNISGTTLGRATLIGSAYTDGWNSVKLNRSVKINKDQTLYVGYILHLDEGEDYDCILFDQSPYGGKTGINWYGYDNNWFNNTAGINRNVCIRAVASGTNVPNNDVTLLTISNADGGEYVTQNKPTDFIAYVQNNGTDPVTSLTLNVEAKGQTTGDVVCNGFSIPNNEPYAVTLKGLEIPAEGNYNGVFTATKVNGADDPDNSDNSVTRYGYSIKEGAKPAKHNVLFEEFTAEANRGSYDADTLYRGAADLSQQSVITVKHHLTYHNTADQFSLGGDNDYEGLYGKSQVFTPAICIDRRHISGFDEEGPAYFSADQYVTAMLIQQVGNIWSFVELTPKAELAEDGKTLNVTVEGHASVNEMPRQSDGVRLTTWLVEDSITSTQQAGQTSFVQNGVLRRILSDNVWGDDVDITGYDFSKTYATELDPSWNRKNLRVVTFLSNYDSSDATNLMVFNAAEASLPAATGISSISNGNNSNMKVVGVYDLSGRRVDGFQSGSGIYIVKYSDGINTVTKKVAVK